MTATTRLSLINNPLKEGAVKTFRDEALEIIQQLLATIDWLGGDAYENEATAEQRNKAEEFLDKHMRSRQSN